MYTREIQEPRHAPVENGIPLQGTWTEAFEEVDLLNIRRPYTLPLPRWVKNYRLKEWESFIIQDDRYFIQARLSNLKYYHTALVVMHDRETNERLQFDKLIPGGARQLPHILGNASVDSRSRGFFFRIHSWLDTKSISLALHIDKRRSRPAFTAYAALDLAETTPVAVSLLFSEFRNMYVFKALASVNVNVVYGGRHIHLNPAKTSALFCDYKGYYPYRMRSTWCTGMGFTGQNQRFGFSLGENQAKEPYSNNENALWLNGRLTPLPPVKITRSGGTESDWIIQDMEGMVDLVFTPKEQAREIKQIIFAASDYENPLGYFNGKVISAEGEEVPVKNIWGMAEKLYMRV